MFLRTEPDARLVAQARKGNVEAFNCLIERWEKRLYNYLRKLLGRREDALDLCQDTFLKAYRSLGSLEEPEKFPQWLFRIGHNLAFSHLRQQARRADSAAYREEGWEGALPEPVPSSTPRSATGGLAGLELELAVAQALESLPPEQREVIVLKIYHGLPFAEIAEILCCPLSTVKSRLYAGFARLRELLLTPQPRATWERER